MEKFVFVLHHLSFDDLQMGSPFVRHGPDFLLEYMLQKKKPFEVSHITGVKSPYAEAEGWFVGCPLTAKQMMELPEEFVIDRIVETGKVAEELGAKILGLGAFTSIVGDAGITIAERLNIAVTSGNSYTVATALEGTREAARLMGKDLRNAEVAIIGASGSIGSACARILSREVRHINLVARRIGPLEELAQELNGHDVATFSVSSDVKKSLHKADVVIAVTSAVDFIIDPSDLKSGAVVCDVARPRNVFRNVSALRKDVLVIEGGVIHVPGNVDFRFNFGFPPHTCFACMAETMILALEGRYENFTLGRNLDPAQIDTISELDAKHGFTMTGLHKIEHEVITEMIGKRKRNVSR